MFKRILIALVLVAGSLQAGSGAPKKSVKVTDAAGKMRQEKGLRYLKEHTKKGGLAECNEIRKNYILLARDLAIILDSLYLNDDAALGDVILDKLKAPQVLDGADLIDYIRDR